MKKIIISTTILLLSMCVLHNCTEEDYDAKYKNPAQTSDVGLEQLMAGTLTYSIDWVMSTYNRFFGWEIQNLCKQANTIGITLDNGTYYNIEGYTDGQPPYSLLSKMIAGYKLMESVFNALPEADKPMNEVYMMAVETVMYGMTAYIMSSFGDIPFDEVGTIASTGNTADAHPHFQDDKELYKMVMTRLDELNAKFATVKKPNLFIPQDFICHGDLAAWRRLANSLRLRAALLVSTQGDLASEGQQVIKEILNDPTGRPIIENIEQHVCYNQMPEGSGSKLEQNGGSGFDCVNLKTGSSEIIKRMQKAGDGGEWDADKDDPRLPIFFCLATKYGEFPVNKQEDVRPPLPDTVIEGKLVDRKETGRAIPSVFRGASASMSYDTFWKYFKTSDTRAYFSRIREHGFFRNNRKWDNPVITAAEIWFIKAEVYQRGWVTGDAKAAFTEGIKQSIKFYMMHHKNKTTHEETSITGNDRPSNHARAVINPDLNKYDDAWIDAFAEARWNKRIDDTDYAAGKLEAIMEQKWLNFGYVYAGEQWNDLRRTGYPRMLYLKDNDPTAEIPYPRNRNRYPEKERNYNMNFSQVSANDNYKDVLFWAKADWHDGPTW